jgi:hypothetical protein
MDEADRPPIASRNHCVSGKDQFLTPAFFCFRLIDILGSPIQFDRCQLTEVSHETHAFSLRRCCFVCCGRCRYCSRRQFTVIDMPRPAVAMQCVFRSIIFGPPLAKTALVPLFATHLDLFRQILGGLVLIIKHPQSCPQFLWTTLWKSSRKWRAAGLSPGIHRNAHLEAECDKKRAPPDVGQRVNPPHFG